MLSRAEDVELIAALHNGEGEQPRWRGFLRGLQRRTGADECLLFFCHGAPPAAAAMCWSSISAPAAHSVAEDAGMAISALRPGRIYSFEELTPGERYFPDAQLNTVARFGRAARLLEENNWTAWLAIRRDSADFSATDSVLLSALLPHLASALRNFAAFERERFRAQTSEDALARAGLAWWAVSENEAHASATATYPKELATKDNTKTLTALAGSLDGTSGAIACLQAGGLVHHVLTLQPEPGALAAPPPARAIALIRHAAINDPLQLQRLQAIWPLSRSEARLTLCIAHGMNLEQSAAAMGVTAETARNYSKRAYAKMGARGAPDLVRMVLTSVAALG